MVHVRVTIDPHPLLADLMTGIRDVTTTSSEFTSLVDRAASVLLVRATSELPTVPSEVRTPLEITDCRRLAHVPVLVPILRAGLGMLPAAKRLLPASAVAFVGLRRDERTATPTWYLEDLPESLAGTTVLVLEPMVATGGTLGDVLSRLDALGAPTITVVSLICAPEGVDALQQRTSGLSSDVHLVVATTDRALNDDHVIVPGLGDAGDRLFASG